MHFVMKRAPALALDAHFLAQAVVKDDLNHSWRPSQEQQRLPTLGTLLLLPSKRRY